MIEQESLLHVFSCSIFIFPALTKRTEDEEGNASSQELHFFYDSQSKPAFVEFEGERYRYVHSLQGNIIAIVDSVGSTVVKYKYDAWGKPTLTDCVANSIIGDINPFRYRGYVWDEETDLFYLRNRYYDPTMIRFLNADIYIFAKQGFTGANVFTYCSNNSVLYSDGSGNRYCAAVRVSEESRYDRFISCNFQKNVSLEKAGKVKDITAKLNTFMEENATRLQNFLNENGYFEACLYFYHNVKDGGELDIKLTDEWQFEDGISYIYNGQVLRYDDPGNINYGYIGGILFNLLTLYFGAGLNQIAQYGFKFGDITTFYDDPRDNNMIRWGYQLYQVR